MAISVGIISARITLSAIAPITCCWRRERNIIAIDIAGAHILERGLTVQVLESPVQVERLHAVVERGKGLIMNCFGHHDIDTADQVDQFHKSIKIDAHVILNRLTDEAADRVFGCLRAATGIAAGLAQHVRCVDFGRRIRMRNRHPEIAREREHAGRLAGGVKRNEQHGVGQRQPSIIRPGINAERQDVDRRHVGHGQCSRILNRVRHSSVGRLDAGCILRHRRDGQCVRLERSRQHLHTGQGGRIDNPIAPNQTVEYWQKPKKSGSANCIAPSPRWVRRRYACFAVVVNLLGAFP